MKKFTPDPDGIQPHELLFRETFVTDQDWKRIKNYTPATLKRHTKLIVLATQLPLSNGSGTFQLPKLNFN